MARGPSWIPPPPALGGAGHVTLRVASSVLVLQPPGHGLEPQAPRHLMAKDSDARACARSCTCPLLGTLFGSRSLVSWNHLSFVRSPDSYYNSESRLIPVPVGLNFLLQVDRSNLSLILVDRTVASPKSGVFGLASIGRSPGPAGAIRPRQPPGPGGLTVRRRGGFRVSKVTGPGHRD